jgi:hypothetical protein
MAAREQPRDDRTPEDAGCTEDDDSHGSSLRHGWN